MPSSVPNLKRVLSVVLAVVFVVSCQKKEDSAPANSSPNGGGGVIAGTPQTRCNLPNTPGGQSFCTPDYYRQNGWQPYPYQWNYGQQFCGCPSGTRPVWTLEYGLGCAPDNYYQSLYSQYPNRSYFGVWDPYAPTYWSQWYNNNNNIPQTTYQPTTQNCYPEAVRACDTRYPNTCGNGGECRPAGGGSIFGICVYPNYYNPQQYSYNYNCRTYNWGIFNGYYCSYGQW
jgi:hypothetical protein